MAQYVFSWTSHSLAKCQQANKNFWSKVLFLYVKKGKYGTILKLYTTEILKNLRGSFIKRLFNAMYKKFSKFIQFQPYTLNWKVFEDYKNFIHMKFSNSTPIYSPFLYFQFKMAYITTKFKIIILIKVNYLHNPNDCLHLTVIWMTRFTLKIPVWLKCCHIGAPWQS